MVDISPYALTPAMVTVLDTPALAVPWLLMASWLYYEQNLDTPLSDTEYDAICAILLKCWHEVEHPHKSFITLDDLRAGSLYALRVYPTITKNAALQWRDDWKKGRLQMTKQCYWHESLGERAQRSIYAPKLFFQLWRGENSKLKQIVHAFLLENAPGKAKKKPVKTPNVLEYGDDDI